MKRTSYSFLSRSAQSSFCQKPKKGAFSPSHQFIREVSSLLEHLHALEKALQQSLHQIRAMHNSHT